MAQDTVWGYLTSDLVPGKSVDLSKFMGQFRSANTPLLNAVSPNLNNLSRRCMQPTHLYYDLQVRVKRTTLNGAITNSDTTIVLSDECAKAGEYIAVDKEIILLGTTSDNLTFSTCTRAQKSTSAVSHADGAGVRLMDIPAVQGSADGTGDSTFLPNEITTYTGIVRQDISVPGTVEATQVNWHDGSDYARQMAEKMEGAKGILESWLVHGVATAPSGQSTASMPQGLISRLSSQTTDLTGVNGGDLSVGTLESAVKTRMDRGGEGPANLIALLNIRQAQIFNKFGLPYLSTDQAGALGYAQNTRVADLGGCTIALIPMAKLDSIGLLIDQQFVKVGPLEGRGFFHGYAGSDGDRTKGRILGEYTFEIYCPWAHKVWTSMSNA